MPLYDLIKGMPIFDKFTEFEKQMFANMDHSLIAFNKGDMIVKEGEQFTSLYLILKGTVIITKTDFQSPLGKLRAGQVFGEMSFLSKKPRYSSVIANERVFVIRMTEASFKKVDPVIKEKIKDYLVDLLIMRLDGMNDILISMANFARGHLLP
jgi:CRP/FNR family cyclic AMP-dependent transcriptional regulator